MKALERIAATWPDLDAWRQRMAEPVVPEPGSPLDLDDHAAIGWLTSQLAAAGLGSARNHLHAIRVHIEARQGFPEATGTLLRGALLSSAQTVWLLAPESAADRQSRSRLLALEVFGNHRKALDDLLLIEPAHEGTRQVRDHVAERLTQINDLRASLCEGSRFQSTAVIEQAALKVFGAGFDVEARAEWRRLSGHAHGLPWSFLGVPSTEVVADTSDGTYAAFVATGSYDESLNAYLLAHGLAKAGWQRLDALSGRVPASEV